MRLPDLTPGHPDVETSAALVGTTVDAIAVANVLTIVCGFVNNGETAVNISGIMGSLNDPVDFARYMHNFSGVAIGEVVEPGGEMSLEYRIQIPLGFPEYPVRGRGRGQPARGREARRARARRCRTHTRRSSEGGEAALLSPPRAPSSHAHTPSPSPPPFSLSLSLSRSSPSRWP
jgi:hypothetical protein